MAEDPEGYEADAVDLSIGGMALRTSLLPDRGSELECRFALEDGASIRARGEVVWAQDSGEDAGEFGLRFTHLEQTDESAIQHSFAPSPRVSEPAGAAPSAPTALASSTPSEARARLHIPGMSAPLRARVRQEMDDVVVLGSDLSFLKLGEKIDIERAGGTRRNGRLEDVTVEVDAESRIARLVLTVGLAHETANAPARVGSMLPPPMPVMSTESMQPVPLTARMPSVPAPKVARMPVPDPEIELHDDPYAISDDAVGDDLTRAALADTARHDSMDSDVSPLAPGRTPPAWLVAMLHSLRGAGSVLRATTAPAFRAMRGMAQTATRSLLGRARGTKADEAAVAPKSGLRKQQGVASVPAPNNASAVMPAGKKYGFYVLAAGGVAAIVFALVSSSRDPHPRTPQAQVAVAAPAATTPEATPTPADPNAAATDPNAAVGTPGLEHAPPPQGELAGADTAPSPSEVAHGGSAAGAPAAPVRRMPSDLVAAARSRNADVVGAPPSIRGGSRAARPVPPAAAPPAPVAVASARMLGNPAVRTGTVLRLRMDGPIAGLAGGASGPNAIVIRMSGRQALDHAAPLVHQDTRLVNAGVFNRAGSSELTLRFRDATPGFSVHAHGSVLEVVLAPPARVATVAAAPHVVRPLGPSRAARVVHPISARPRR